MTMALNTMQPARLAIFIALALAGVSPTLYASETFNTELVELDNPGMGKADLSAFESGSQAPGTYHVDIILDDRLLETRDIRFMAVKDANGSETLQPCLSIGQLKAWGVKTALFPQLAAGESECADLRAIPQASADFQFGAQRLAISIPQAAIDLPARGYVPPDMWDEGITAAMLNYSLSGANSRARSGAGTRSDSQYANLRPGINVGPWRLRNYTTWSRDASGQDKWDNVYTLMQRAIIPLQAQLTLGDSSAPADVFDSMPFRGVQLASDDDMLPDSLKGYAPVVRGIARTNAQVVVRQNGYQTYQSYVAPGAFEIADMYPTGGAGDLDVTIVEADGSEQHFTLPYASLPVLQREGRLKYALTAGQYRSYNRSVEKTPFGQLTGIYGLPHGITLYGGVQGADKYQSAALGVGKNMGDLGAVSADVTQGWSTPEHAAKTNGQSWRARYSKNFINTGTNFSIAGYRYSTRGYYGMQDVLDSYGDSSALQDRRRNRAELTMSQTLGDNLGALTLSAAREDYWNDGKSMASWSVGYSNYWHNISYGLTWTYSKNVRSASETRDSQKNADHDQLLAFNVSIPLDKFLSQTWANYGMNASGNNGTTHNVGLNGVALENRALNWNVQQGYGTEGVGYTGNVNADYKGTYGEVTAGYGYDKNSERLNYGLQGGILAHADGITLSQPLGETSVLIKAPGAHDVDIRNQPGVRTDFRGYTVVSNLSVYRKNDLTLDPETMPDDVELEINTRTVTPTRGAVVRADYLPKSGRRVLMTLIDNDRAVPFGAVVTLVGDDSGSFIVGDRGQVYLTGMREQGTLVATWGSQSSQQCRADFTLPNHSTYGGIADMRATCRQER
ncbi:fimbrial biogenesis outer membrane usher protein [Enterobacter hormaechei subsp. steigerwaltii]|uniref:fimbria/pilus outer membrane usher protein n=1 Tax=Enterobacter hormaechei TaxID=158836 RepID=UPI00079354CE|nr:fimbria/pilus outer membrane usher protein [Enterobacter hormaechei]MCC9337635.1 fimbrial biogenesis outer membrane usher protein [Enterobacter hormaechei subsp. steigerwaltii]MCC9376414.1 fimbrial biogenesis outer membrane usher protein [Enterobacter hormaechei subsp. steigerwaltii]MCC9393805.1 fimbrial biogenesis outer membrane usher protein [Enterobacter hormaechei subsp. steigerwaltii]MCC9417488.1 fimbrial biogenesis outer membrane usher protein [Enterobacter hormaechei subsp. steigerwal